MQLYNVYTSKTSMNKKISSTSGLVLIELMLVASLIALLASVGLVSASNVRSKARDSQKTLQVHEVGTALKIMHSNTGRVPDNYNLNGTFNQSGGGNLPACEGIDPSGQAYQKSMDELTASKAITAIPSSPGFGPYCYYDYGGADGDGATFSATLENPRNGQTQISNRGQRPPPGAKAPPCDSYGDVNNDGWVSEDDRLTNYNNLTSEQQRRADVDGDEILDSRDTALFNSFLDGTSTTNTFPACNFRPPLCDSMGDVDSDGLMTTKDLRTIQRRILGSITFTAEQDRRADVNFSGTASSLDLALIQRVLLNISNVLPACSLRQPPCDSMGDVDNDGLTTNKDAQLIRGIINLGTVNSDLTEEQRRRADVDGSGIVDSSDDNLIQRYASNYDGQTNTFPVCQP